MKDLLCLVADKNMEAVFRGLLSRHQALQIRPIDFETIVHPQRDPGCLQTGADLLREAGEGYAHGVLIFDFAWEGCPARTANKLEEIARERMKMQNLLGWGEVVVIDPELENWLFTNSPRFSQAVGWNDPIDIREWLHVERLWPFEAQKPSDPKRAMEAIFRKTRRPRSSAIYRIIASKVSFQGCVDNSFLRLRDILQNWFGV